MDIQKQLSRVNSALGYIEKGPRAAAPLLKRIRDDLKEELRPKPETKPLKLEAGCWVRSIGSHHKGAAQFIYGDYVLWLNDSALAGPVALELSHSSNLTVVEAATPEVGDYVQIAASELQFGTISGICKASGGDKHLVLGRGLHYLWYRRGSFTILCKANQSKL